MNKQVLRILLFSTLAVFVCLVPKLVGQDSTDGFGKGHCWWSASPTVDSSQATETAQASETAQAPETAQASEAAQVTGTIDVDTYLNIRTGPWGKITGSLTSNAKVQIISLEGDWYKVLIDGVTSYIHAYYVSTPDRPSHQGIEPPILGSDQSPDAVAVTANVGDGTFGGEPCSPMPDATSSEFGPRDMFGNSFHYGIDLPVPTGTRLNSLGNGTVVAAGYDAGGGNFVKVQYANGYTSFYCHLESISVQEGQTVATGQEIASSDNTGEWTTGAHLHMGIMDSSGEYVNPRDVPGIVLPVAGS
ncbi:MAG: M23 family metallopeptidase [Candidatus Ozemobacteraceae bacterium]